ncbi:MAG: pantetheine-phosphate adenylyltransferase [Pseudomonadota bacterium]
MRTTVIYPGSFDPITYGHIDLIERAAKLFDRVIVTIATNANKQYTLTTQERKTLIESVITTFDNVDVEVCHGLVTDFAAAKGATMILRGIRSSTDMDFEFQLAGMNKQLNNTIETLFMMTNKKYSHISSSIIKEIAVHGKLPDQFVPPIVAKMLVEKLNCE